MLERFRLAQQPGIDRLRALADQDALPAPWPGARPSFAAALAARRGRAVIAEYKRASPSKGVINLALGPEEVALAYARAGATALSVLTEAQHFQGELGFLERMRPAGLPMLRKDFILDPLQIVETAATPASALLLIVRMIAQDELVRLIELAGQAGLDAVVEVFDRADLDRAKAAGARIIQVNNRDLDTLSTDLNRSEELIGSKASEELWISASGIAVPQDLTRVLSAGFDAVLVGTSLMRQANPGQALAGLLDGLPAASGAA